MADDISFYVIRNILFGLAIKILIPKDRQVIVTEPGMKIVKYNSDKKKVFVHDLHNEAIEYSDNQKPIIVDKGQEVLIPADDEVGIIVPRSYPVDSTSIIHFNEIEQIMNDWAKENEKEFDWHVGPRDIYLATYTEATIKKVMTLMPAEYKHEFQAPGADYPEFSDCDDYAGVHFEYWIKRILPGCAYIIVEGYDPGGHEFGAIITRDKKIMWINEVDPTKYNILGIVRF